MRMEHQTNASRGFTLIEMLAVLAIIVILIVVALPTVTSLTRSTGLQSGTRTIANTLSLARQTALTRGSRAAVVFIRDLTTSAQPVLGGDVSGLRYRTFAVIFSNTQTRAWEYVGKWETLPVGAVFLSGNQPGSLDYIASRTVPFPYSGGPDATLATVEFTQWGVAVEPTAARQYVTLGEGNVNNG